MMRRMPILWVTAVVGLPLIASAEPPLSDHSLGVVEGTAAFCAELDSKSAGEYQQRAQRVAQALAEKQLLDSRATKEYKSAYESVRTVLGGMAKEQARQACSNFLRGGK